MNFFETIEARQSIRAFQNKTVEPEKLDALLNAINRAPSAGNCQAYQVYVVRDPEMKKKFAEAALRQEFVAQAPVVLIFCLDPARAARYGKRGEQLYCQQDAAIAVAYAQLAATALGLATCWVGAFNEESVSRAAGLPAEHRPVAILPIGYAAEQPPRSSRRTIEDLVRELR
ncbi:MAG: nitroreductase family protein [Verrucomicrobia bacterium]|nr:nitroreductase family protein [Verrucomicrobiota bacterium]